ncbi:MAG: glycosyltransferase family 2 protein [Chloroflexales bacterium]|nr:glycosyltransferase family 2 protein [Chloroflexales bacterium]
MTPMSSALRAVARATDSERWLRPRYSAEVSVVIVNFNARAMLDRTLKTLFTSGQRSTMEVLVIDNGSQDGSQALVAESYPQVRLVANERNLGLTRANNQGMELAEGRYILLLNNDTIISPDAVDALVRYLDQHPGVGAVGGKVLNIDGSIQGTVKAHPTPMAALFGRRSALTRLWPNNPFSRRYLTYMHVGFDAPFAAGSVSSCAMLVRREAIAGAGPIDERFFVYWSDVDWCRAIWEAGFEVHCTPESVIVHDEHKGGTHAGRKRSRAAIVDFHRGAYLYYSKWCVAAAWHPLHLAAMAGLAVRGALVMLLEDLLWARRQRRET